LRQRATSSEAYSQSALSHVGHFGTEASAAPPGPAAAHRRGDAGILRDAPRSGRDPDFPAPLTAVAGWYRSGPPQDPGG